MDRFFQALRPTIRYVVRVPAVALIVALLLSAAGFQFARQLKINSDLSELIPPEYPSVQALERLRDNVGSESSVDVAIESPSFAADTAFARAFIPRAMALQGDGYAEPFFSRFEYRRNTEFLKDNALYFSTSAELDELDDYLDRLIEDARLEANPFFFDLDDEFEDDEPDSTAESLKETYDEIVGKDFPVSEDSTTLVIRFYPTGAQTDINFIEQTYAALDVLTAEMEPANYHPEMKVVTAGRLLRTSTEIRAITDDVTRSFGAGVGAVLLLVIIYFVYKGYRANRGYQFSSQALISQLIRIPVMALVIAVPLLMSLSWTFGLAFLRFGSLNLMTSTLGLVLFGLGVDFGIHFFARYTEERASGKSVADAAEETFVSTGQAIAIGAFSTAAALYVLMFADFRGFSEFGFISGTGILLALIAMLYVMPALLSLFERFKLLNLDTTSPHEDVSGQGVFPTPRIWVGASLLAVLVSVVLLPRVSFEYNFGNLEPEYTDYSERASYVSRVYQSRGRNPAYIVVEDANEVTGIVEQIRLTAAADTSSPTVDRVESMQDRFPTTEAGQQQKLERLAYIREKLDDPFLAEDDSEDLARLRRAAQTTEPISLEQVPEFLKTRFTSKSGEIGQFVIIYPSVGLSDGRQSMAFSDDVGRVVMDDGRVYYSGSTSLVAADMLRLMQREAPWMVLATFVMVLGLMLLNFGSLRWALLAIVPLVVGVLWMFLAMEIFDLKLNFYNLIVLPAVLGIGNDAGVHIVHRYRELGPGSIMTVLRSTGEHVAMGSFTTMIGFAGLLLSFHPGLESIGQLAVVGIGATLISALLFLPALLQVLERRGGGS